MCQISIVIPVYNAAQYLRECIDSVLIQSFCDFEIILVDDGSKDESGRICDEYAQKDKRVRVFHQKNSGVSVARNVALDNANGEWIAFVDADDVLQPDAFLKLYEATASNTTDVVLGSSSVLVNGVRHPYHTYRSLNSTCVVDHMSHPALWGYLIRASIIKNNNIRFVPRIAYSEDVVFLAEVAVRCKGIVHITNDVYLYRRNDTSASVTTDGVMSSGHQFHAAYILKCLADTEKDKDKECYLRKKQNALIKNGCYDFALLSFSLRKYPQFERQYLNYFDGRVKLFMKTINARLVVLRRKILCIKDNPLTGEIGLITKVKRMFNYGVSE